MQDEISSIVEACGDSTLKVILETGELVTFDKVRKASDIAMYAGADFIKTSTGKISPAATMPVTLVMLEAIRDFYYRTGKKIGMKPAGGLEVGRPHLIGRGFGAEAQQAGKTYRIGIDVGGTFTKAVLIDNAGFEEYRRAVPATIAALSASTRVRTMPPAMSSRVETPSRRR